MLSFSRCYTRQQDVKRFTENYYMQEVSASQLRLPLNTTCDLCVNISKYLSKMQTCPFSRLMPSYGFLCMNYI